MPVLSASVEVYAAVTLADGDPSRAAHLLGVVAALRGMRSMPSADVRRTVERCTELLGEAAYQQAYDGGASLSRAAAYADLDVVPGSDQVRRR
jgi:hypothetical protein